MDSNDDERQDEINALSAIFAQDWTVEDRNNHRYSVTLTPQSGTSKDSFKLHFKLPVGYPTTEKPIFDISAPWMTRVDKANLISELNDLCEENQGFAVIYQLINKAQITLNSIAERDGHISESVESSERTAKANGQTECDLVRCDIPIMHGDPLVDRKSTFQAHLAPIQSPQEAQLVLDKLMENRKIQAATHNMWAYRVSKPDSSTVNQNCDDDGETHAGSRLLHLLQIVDATNVIVIVSRWYGGIQLGPDRFKHINNVTRQLLELHNYINK